MATSYMVKIIGANHGPKSLPRTRRNSATTVLFGASIVGLWSLYKKPGQKNEVLKIRVKRFSSPMRRGGGSSGGSTGQGQVPGALREWGVEE